MRGSKAAMLPLTSTPTCGSPRRVLACTSPTSAPRGAAASASRPAPAAAPPRSPVPSSVPSPPPPPLPPARSGDRATCATPHPRRSAASSGEARRTAPR
eukprot:scaffold98562_cov60-Phaeocystis_antarctica.AAC.2